MPTLKIQKADGTFEFLQLAGEEFADIGNQVLDVKSQLAQTQQQASHISISIKNFPRQGVEVDDTARLRRAIDKTEENGTLILEGREYFVSASLSSGKQYPLGGNMINCVFAFVINKNIRIVGERGTKITLSTPSSSPLPGTIYASKHIELENIEFNVTDLARFSGSHLRLEGTKTHGASCLIKNCKFYGTYYQVEFYDYVQNSKVIDSLFDNSVGFGGAGVHTTDCRKCQNIEIVGNQFLGSRISDAIEFNNDTLTTRNGDTNKTLFTADENTKDIIIRHNIIKNYTNEVQSTSGGMGVGMAGKSENVVIEYNYFENIERDCIHLEHSRYGKHERVNKVVINGNEFRNYTGNGISIYETETDRHTEDIDLVISKNIFEVSPSGVSPSVMKNSVNLSSGSNVFIFDNTFRTKKKVYPSLVNFNGMLLSNVSNINIHHNLFYGYETCIRFLRQEGGKSVYIDNNKFKNSKVVYFLENTLGNRLGQVFINGNKYNGVENIIDGSSGSKVGLFATNEYIMGKFYLETVEYKRDSYPLGVRVSTKTIPFDWNSNLSNFDFESYSNALVLKNHKVIGADGTVRNVTTEGFLYNVTTEYDVSTVNGSNVLSFLGTDAQLNDINEGAIITVTGVTFTSSPVMIVKIDRTEKKIYLSSNATSGATSKLRFQRAVLSAL